jgi:hypothetical protein
VLRLLFSDEALVDGLLGHGQVFHHQRVGRPLGEITLRVVGDRLHDAPQDRDLQEGGHRALGLRAGGQHTVPELEGTQLLLCPVHLPYFCTLRLLYQRLVLRQRAKLAEGRLLRGRSTRGEPTLKRRDSSPPALPPLPAPHTSLPGLGHAQTRTGPCLTRHQAPQTGQARAWLELGWSAAVELCCTPCFTALQRSDSGVPTPLRRQQGQRAAEA